MAYVNHLNDLDTYQKLTYVQAVNRITAIRNIIKNFIKNYLPGKINEADHKFLKQSLQIFNASWEKNAEPTFA